MRIRGLALAATAFIAMTAMGEVKMGIAHTPAVCVRAGELPLLLLNVTGKGELRGYFRRVNSTDWCSVEGTNDGPLSRVVLPRFEAGDEIEYFFVLTDGVRIVARSGRIYRIKVSSTCDLPSARHVLPLTMHCGEDEQAIPSALGAGYLMGEETDGDPPYTSPDRPQ